MKKAEQFRKMALSFAEAEEAPHHEITSFRIKKKIFASLNEKENRATVKLNSIEQSVFCAFDSDVVYPVPNAWGKQGWTNINLKLVKEEMLKDLLCCAYCNVAPKKLAELYRVNPGGEP